MYAINRFDEKIKNFPSSKTIEYYKVNANNLIILLNKQKLDL